MNKFEEAKNKISQLNSDKKDFANKIEEEKKNFKRQSDKINDDAKEKIKKITTQYSTKVQPLQKKLDALNEKHQMFAGEFYMSFVNQEISQEQLNELTNLLKG